MSGVGDNETDQLSTDGVSEESKLEKSRVKRSLEKSWPIREQLKHENAEDLFAWIGDCIAEVVEDGVQTFGEELPEELPMGVTFSFPMMYLAPHILRMTTDAVSVNATCQKLRSCQWVKVLPLHQTWTWASN